jgi:hypothetical protein
VRQGSPNVAGLQGSADEVMPRFNIVGVKFQRFGMPMVGLRGLAAIPKEIAQAAA